MINKKFVGEKKKKKKIFKSSTRDKLASYNDSYLKKKKFKSLT